MNVSSTPMRVRIHSHLTQTRFLHVEDALGIGKIRLFAGVYRRGRGAQQHAHHFLDVADARVLFDALARAEPEFSYREYKGTPLERGGAISRVLSVQVKGDTIYVELKNGPGKLTPTGAVTPAGKPDVEVNVAFKRYEARRLGAVVLAYLRAWDVMHMLAHRHLPGQPRAFEVVPAASEAPEPAGPNGSGKGSANVHDGAVPGPEAADSGQAVRQVTAVPEPATGNGQAESPVGKAAAEARARRTAEALFGPDAPGSSDAVDLRYGDGTTVDPGNSVERQAFLQYRQAHQRVPATRAVSRAYYQRRRAAA